MKRIFRTRGLSFSAVFVLVFLGIAGPAQAVGLPAQNGPALGAGKVTICHHPPGQPDGVYIYQSVSKSSVFGGNGHDRHEGDVIPEFDDYKGSAKYKDDPARYDQFLANGCSDTPPTTSPAPTPCPTTETPVPTPTTATPTPSPTTGTPTPSPTTGTPTPTGTATGTPTGTPTGTATGTAPQGNAEGAGGGGAANCTCPEAAAAIAAASAAGQPIATAGPDGGLVDPVSGNTVRPCPNALADTGVESAGFPTGMAILGVGTLVAGAAVIVLTLLPRGRHS